MDVELAYRADGTLLALERPRRRGRGQEPPHPDPAQPDQARQHRQRLPDPRGALRGLVGAHQQVPERGQPRHRQAVHVLRRRARDGPARPAPRPGPRRAAAAQLRHRRPDAATRRRPAPSTTAATTRPRCAARSSASTTRAGAPSRRARARRAAACSASASPRRWSPRAPTSPPTRSSPGGARRLGLGGGGDGARGARRHRCACRSATRRAGRATRRCVAQIVADELGVTPDAVTRRPRLRLGDHARGSTSPATTRTSSR